MQFVGYLNKDELGRLAAKAGRALRDQIRNSAIWLDEDLFEQVSELEAGFNDTWIKFTTKDLEGPQGEQTSIKAWHEAWKSVSEDVPKVRRQIMRRFRETLGVVSNQA